MHACCSWQILYPCFPTCAQVQNFLPVFMTRPISFQLAVHHRIENLRFRRNDEGHWYVNFLTFVFSCRPSEHCPMGLSIAQFWAETWFAHVDFLKLLMSQTQSHFGCWVELNCRQVCVLFPGSWWSRFVKQNTEGPWGWNSRCHAWSTEFTCAVTRRIATQGWKWRPRSLRSTSSSCPVR